MVGRFLGSVHPGLKYHLWGPGMHQLAALSQVLPGTDSQAKSAEVV